MAAKDAFPPQWGFAIVHLCKRSNHGIDPLWQGEGSMPARCCKLVEEALAILDQSGNGSSLAACHLQTALTHLGQPETQLEALRLEGLFWWNTDSAQSSHH